MAYMIVSVHYVPQGGKYAKTDIIIRISFHYGINLCFDGLCR